MLPSILFIENYSGESGKIQALEEIMTDAFDSGHRILLFSQFTSMLEIIKQFLDQKSVEYFYLDGSTKAKTVWKWSRPSTRAQESCSSSL